MPDPNVSVEVSGQVWGIAGAHTVHIENLYLHEGTPRREEASAGEAVLPLCPYRGLAIFRPEDAALFFGRESTIDALADAVGKSALTALVGGSGTGKSSVVLAGVAPRLDKTGRWRISYLRLGTELDHDPFLALARALNPSQVASDDERLKGIRRLADSLREGELSLADVLSDCLAKSDGNRILLIVDQFEEVFTLVRDEKARQHFIDVLVAAFCTAQKDGGRAAAPRAALLMTLRSDFYGHALRHRPLAEALEGHVKNLGPMTRGELRSAIESPARGAGVSFQPGLVEALLDEVQGKPGSLPLLQFALREMWWQQEGRLITRKSYDTMGGISGALAGRAETVFMRLTDQGQDHAAERALQRLFTRLVSLGEGQEDTRRVVDRSEVGDDAWDLAQKLADEDNRLVTLNAPALRRQTVEVVHEALIRHWPRLVAWVNSDRAFQTWVRRIAPAVEQWRSDAADEGLLLRGSLLAQGRELLVSRAEDLNDAERSFIETSVRESKRLDDEKEQARLAQLEHQRALVEAAQKLAGEQRRRARVSLTGTLVAVVLAVCAAFLAYKAEQQSRVASARQVTAVARTLSANARLMLDAGRPQLAALLVAESLQREPHPDADLTARQVLSQMMQPSRVLTHSDYVSAMAVTADGTALATRTNAPPESRQLGQPAPDLVLIRNTETGAELGRITVGGISVAPAESLKFSGSGRHLVICENDGLTIWEVSKNRKVKLTTRIVDVSTVAFSADESLVAVPATDERGQVALYDLGAGTVRRTLHLSERRESPPRVVFLQFSIQDPNRLFVATSENQFIAVDTRTGTLGQVFTGKTDLDEPGPKMLRSLEDAVLSPDETVLAVSDLESTWLWSLAGPRPRLLAFRPKQRFARMAFDANGKYLAASNSEGEVSVTEVASGKVLAEQRLGGFVEHLAISEDGQLVVTAHRRDGGVVWDWPQRTIRGRTSHEADLTGLVFIRGKIFSSSYDARAIIWALSEGEPRTASGMSYLNGSPNGEWMVASAGKSLVLLRASGAEAGRVPGRAERATFNDSSTALVVTDDKQLRVYTVEPFALKARIELPSGFAEWYDGSRPEQRLRHWDQVSDPVSRALLEPESVEKAPVVDLTSPTDTTFTVGRWMHRTNRLNELTPGAPPAPELRMATQVSSMYPADAVAMSRNGHLLLAAKHDSAWLFDVSQGVRLVARASLGYEVSRDRLADLPGRGVDADATTVEHANIRQAWFDGAEASVFLVTDKGAVWRWDPKAASTIPITRVTNKHLLAGDRLVVADSKGLRVFHRDFSGEASFKLPDVELAALSPGGAVAAVTSLDNKGSAPNIQVIGGYNPGNYRLDLVETGSGAVRQSFFHDASIDAVAFNATGSRVALVGSNQIQRVWDAQTGKEIARMSTSEGGSTIALKDKPDALVTAHKSHLTFSTIGSKSLVHALCRKSYRNLSEAEIRDFLPGEDVTLACPNLPRGAEKHRNR